MLLILPMQVLGLFLHYLEGNNFLFIGGAIANFTLVDKTFEGIIKAIKEYHNLFITKQKTLK